jgi:hypothetical protein
MVFCERTAICKLPDSKVSAAVLSGFGSNIHAEFKRTAENAGRASSKTIIFRNNRFRVFLRRIVSAFYFAFHLFKISLALCSTLIIPVFIEISANAKKRGRREDKNALWIN